MLKIKKITLVVLSIILFIYLTGFLSSPTVEYWVYVGLPQNVLEAKDIEVILPYPFYRGKPIPFYKGTYIKEIFPAVKTAAKCRGADAHIVKDKKYGVMLKISIPHLTKKESEKNKLEIYFMDNTCTPLFFTPLIFVRELQEVYFLSPAERKWYWKKEGSSFRADKFSNTFLYGESSAETLEVGLNFRFKKRFFLGHILIEETLGEGKKNIISKKKWSKHPIKVQEEIKFY